MDNPGRLNARGLRSRAPPRLALPLLGEPLAPGFGSGHVDPALEMGSVRDGQEFGMDVPSHPGLGPELDVEGRADVALELALEDDIGGEDIARHPAGFFNTNQAFAADIAPHFSGDPDAGTTVDLALEGALGR